jgi:hypothetical protein
MHGSDRFEVRDLIKAKSTSAKLAFISACHGAAADVEGTPDEVIISLLLFNFVDFEA